MQISTFNPRTSHRPSRLPRRKGNRPPSPPRPQPQRLVAVGFEGVPEKYVEVEAEIEQKTREEREKVERTAGKSVKTADASVKKATNTSAVNKIQTSQLSTSTSLPLQLLLLLLLKVKQSSLDSFISFKQQKSAAAAPISVADDSDDDEMNFAVGGAD